MAYVVAAPRAQVITESDAKPAVWVLSERCETEHEEDMREVVLGSRDKKAWIQRQCMCSARLMLHKARQRCKRVFKGDLEDPGRPGYGALDAGCGFTMMGEDALEAWMPAAAKLGIRIYMFEASLCFNCGNGSLLKAHYMASIAMCLAGMKAYLRTAAVAGPAPLLIAKCLDRSRCSYIVIQKRSCSSRTQMR